jgi:glycosyltransferase involved in cell wall biosynthesis
LNAASDSGPGLPSSRGTDALLSVVVPAYDEAALIGDFVLALQRQLGAMDLRWEILVVDDGSRDGTGALALAAGRSERVRVVRLSRNFGKEAAMTAGLAEARGDAVIVMDADFQHPLDMIPMFVAHWREGFDMVYGVREGGADEGPLKRVARGAFHRWIGREDRVEFPMNAGDFRLLDRKAVDALARFTERERMMKGLFALLGFRQLGVPYRVAPRGAGKTRFGARRLVRLAATGVTSFSALPLQLFGIAGVAVSVLAFLFAGWLLFEHFAFGNPFDGFTTLATGMMVFGGLQMLSVAALGAYVSRIYREVKARPLYLVDRVDVAAPSGSPRAAPVDAECEAEAAVSGAAGQRA